MKTNIPKLEHVVSINSELGDFLLVGRECDEVQRDKVHVAFVREEPVFRRLRVCHRFLRCERLLGTISKLVGVKTEFVSKALDFENIIKCKHDFDETIKISLF